MTGGDDQDVGQSMDVDTLDIMSSRPTTPATGLQSRPAGPSASSGSYRNPSHPLWDESRTVQAIAQGASTHPEVGERGTEDQTQNPAAAPSPKRRFGARKQEFLWEPEWIQARNYSEGWDPILFYRNDKGAHLPNFEKSDFIDPQSRFTVPHRCLRYEFQPNSSDFNVLHSDSAEAHKELVKETMMTGLQKILGSSADSAAEIKSFVEGIRLRYHTTEPVHAKNGVSSYTCMDMVLPYWDAGLVKVLIIMVFRASGTETVFREKGPSVPPNYILMRGEMPATYTEGTTQEAFYDILDRAFIFFDKWIERHALDGIKLVAAAGDFRPTVLANPGPDKSPREKMCVDPDVPREWAKVIYLVVKVPESDALDPRYSSLLPGFLDVSPEFQPRSEQRIETRLQFPFRSACPFCRSKATHTGNDSNCFCTGCNKVGHHKTKCQYALARMMSTKRGRVDTLEVSLKDLENQAEIVASKMDPVELREIMERLAKRRKAI